MVPMVSLVEGLEAQEVRRGRVGGHGATPLPSNGRRVVRARVGRALANVGEMDVSFVLHDSGGKFKVGHADVTGGVGLGDQSGAQGGRKGGTPKSWWRIVVEVEQDAAHAVLGGIVGAGDGRWQFDEFVEPGRTCGQVVLEPLEVGQGIMDATIKTNAGGVTNGELELAEEATRAGKSNGHGAEFAEQFMPSADEEALLGARNFGKDHRKAFKTGRWEG